MTARATALFEQVSEATGVETIHGNNNIQHSGSYAEVQDSKA